MEHVPMKYYLLAAPLLFWGARALADSPAAVAASNYQAGITAGDNFLSGSRASNFYGFNGSAYFPLAAYLGASLSGTYAHTSIDTNPTPAVTPATAWPLCTTNNDTLGAGLFMRQPSIGRLGVAYNASQLKSQCNATFLTSGGDKLDARVSTAYAEYYFSKVTLGATRSKTRFDTDYRLDSANFTASWYPNNDMRISLGGDGLDFKDTYHVGMEFRPTLLGNSVSFLVDYTTQRQTPTTSSITLGFSYFFNVNVDLITRDRHYR
jgi:hypothetical protein